ncbi:autotransporter outer membrane beta-barrel domain-containing protein, partial [Akkermansia sp. N21169]
MKLDISGNAAFGEGSLLTTVAAPGIDNTSVSATGTVTLPERMSLRFINHDSEGWNAPLSDLVVMDATGGFLNVSGQTLGSGTDFTDWTVTFEKSISLFYTSADLSIGHDGRQLLATPVLNKVNTLDQYAGSETAKAGAGLIWNAGLQKSGSNLDLLLSSIMDDIKTGSASSASHKMAAAAGSTVTSLLGAQQADYRYQQTLLRNRMTTMGLPEGYNYDGELPLWNAWVQATGTYNSLTESGDFAGYKYNTWGGTFGVDTNLSERLTVGLAMSASYGKLTSNGADTLSGDLDIYYANLFARYQKGKWGHNFIVTAGWSDGTVDRTVNYGEGSYTGHGSTSGSTYGAMYEATYDIALNEENNAIFQP